MNRPFVALSFDILDYLKAQKMIKPSVYHKLGASAQLRNHGNLWTFNCLSNANNLSV